MPDFTFITTDEQGQVKKGDSKLIRSSCMRGKNERHDSRRVKRRTKRSYGGKRKSPDAQDEGAEEYGYINFQLSDSPGARLAVKATNAPRIEAPVPDASLLSFLGGVDRRSRDVLFKYLSYSMSIDLLYPVERCLKLPSMENFMLLMAQDKGLLDMTLLITSSINDFVLRRPPSVLTRTHLRSTLADLNAMISEQPNDRNFLSIVFLALGLGNVAAMFGDYFAASAHIHGLQRIATLKDGKKHFDKFPKFKFKISRLDLTYSLCTGNKPVWTNLTDFEEPTSWQPYFSGSQPLPPHLASVLDVPCTCPSVAPSTIFPKFTVIYNDLRYFAISVNSAISSKTFMSIGTFQQSIHSIQSRLIELDGKMIDDVAECVRLGMLALLTTTFRLPGPKMKYAYLHACLVDKLVAIRPRTDNARKILFWVLMMGIIAVFETDEDWIQEVWNRLCGVETEWEAVRRELRNVIWIDFIHDDLGKAAFAKFGGL